jgi:cephalosporin hydroxylase
MTKVCLNNEQLNWNQSFYQEVDSMITIDGDLIKFVDAAGQDTEIGLGTPEAFRLLSKLWLRSGWDTKYVYSFSWMGRPMIQLPEDMLRIQEVIYRVKPDVLIETGIAHGGSLIFYASLFNAMDKGRVIGVDIEIRSHNRKAIEAHEMYDRITMFEGSSIDDITLEMVRASLRVGDRGFVVLDSNHTRTHVLAELNAYSEFVGVGSYIVACDGIMQEVAGAPRTSPEWGMDNPQTAVKDFLAERNDFVIEEPAFPFNEGQITERVTYWPNAFLRRVK